MGIDAGLYLLGISDAIFVLIGIEDDKKGEELFEYYINLRERVVNIDLPKSKKKFDVLAKEVYKKLLSLKKKSKRNC